MAAELPRPGVEVTQVFRSVSPTVITPTLVPCVVGVCRQIVEVLTSTDAGGTELNGDALILLPGFFEAKAATGSPPAYTGLDGLDLSLSVNNGPVVTITFSDPTAAGITPSSLVSQIQEQLADAGVTSVVAETVSDDSFRLRTVGTGEFETIQIDATTSSAVATAFGIADYKTYTGLSSYTQRRLDLPESNLPDPRGNIAQLVFQPETLRAFLALGNGASILELRRTESFLRSGGADVAATLTGSVDLTGLTYGGGGTLNGLTFVVKVNGGTNVTTTFGSPANAAAVVTAINAAMNSAGYGSSVASLSVANHLVLTSPVLGDTSSLLIVSGTAVTALGFTVSQTDTGESAVAAVDDGNGDAVTPLLRVVGADFTAAGAAAVVEGSVDITSVGLYGGGGTLLDTTLTLSDGSAPQSITFGTLADATALLAALNALYGAVAGGRFVFTQGGTGGNKLVITTTNLGDEALVDVVGGDAAALLGLTVAKTRGAPFPPMAGDDLYVDGSFVGVITQVAPGGVVDRLKINKQLPINSDFGVSYYIIAKNLTGAATSTRPSADLIVGSSNVLTIKHEVLRDTTGTPNTTARANLYVSYMAIRKDVTSSATNPGLLRFENTTDLAASLGPISVDNPLALGLYFALVNGPNIQVTGLGVDEVSPDAPYGTVEAFTRAAEYLEAFEVYGIAPLTHDASVGQVFSAHVDAMSSPANKGERVVLFNPSKPANKLDTLVASGTKGNTTGNTGLVFDTGIANLPALLLNAGVSPVGTIPVSEGLFLDIASDAKSYSIESVSGSVVTIRTSFGVGDNDDGFFATTDLNDPPLTSALIDETFAVKLRGDALSVAGVPDRQGIADTYTAMASSVANRRFWQTVPDTAAATLDGVEQLIEGFYCNAGIVGAIGQQPPQQSFTNFPMAGYTRVVGSTDFFTEKQMNQMAAGGNYILVQDAQGAPVIARMALTSDMTSIETRTDSITKVADFTSKFLRKGLKNFIGRFNITQGFLDSLSHVIQGLLSFLVETGVLVGANLNNLIQDEDAPDTVMVDITLDVPYPCNYLRLTLNI